MSECFINTSIFSLLYVVIIGCSKQVTLDWKLQIIFILNNFSFNYFDVGLLYCWSVMLLACSMLMITLYHLIFIGVQETHDYLSQVGCAHRNRVYVYGWANVIRDKWKGREKSEASGKFVICVRISHLKILRNNAHLMISCLR